MKLNKELIDSMAQWVKVNGLIEYGGAKLKDFLNAFRIDQRSYYRWMAKAEFAEAIKKAKEEFKSELEHDIVLSLARAAKGYEYEQTITEYANVGDKPTIKKQTRKKVDVPASVGACVFLLTNLAPERWKNRQAQSVEASVSLESDLESMSDEELAAIVRGEKE